MERNETEETPGARAEETGVGGDERFRKAYQQAAARIAEVKFDQATVGIAVGDLQHHILEANAKLCDIFGYSLEELRGLSFSRLTHPQDLPQTRDRMRRLLAGEIPYYSLEKRYLRKDGTPFWAHTTVTILREADGRTARHIGMVEDVTDLKRTAEALRDETHVLALLNATGTALAGQLDLKTLVQNVTDTATRLSGARFGAFFYNVTDQSGESYLLFTLSGMRREAFEGFGLPRNTPVFHPTFRGESVVRSGDITRDHRYGKVAPHFGMPKGHPPVRSFLAVPVVSRSGAVIGGLFFGHPDQDVFDERSERLVVGIATHAAVAIDNARLYEAAQREIASRERAEAALRETDRRKDEFLATLAHELRNPLAPIRQAALISKASAATEAQKRWSHDVISRQVQHMALLLDDLLDVSRITRGTLELRMEMTELAAVVDAAVETARPSIDSKRHNFSVEIPREPVHFYADPLRLAQVLSNLLTNAAKYTDPGGDIRLKGACAEQTVTLSVTDTGIGIPSQAFARVFTMFSQVKSGQDRSEGGLGIGLALAKGLVELHGGKIEAYSAGAGRGSEFIVRLPLRVNTAPGHKGAVADPVAQNIPQRVLIADDNRDAAESLAMLLRMDGHEVTVVHDGQQALAAFSALKPQAVLLDIGMPHVNGYEVARRMRQGAAGQSITLIAVTGWGQESDKAQALAAGFDHHFTKPVEPDRLRELFRVQPAK